MAYDICVQEGENIILPVVKNYYRLYSVLEVPDANVYILKLGHLR